MSAAHLRPLIDGQRKGMLLCRKFRARPVRQRRVEIFMQQKELVEFIARSLVDNPDQVAVRESEGDQGSVLELSVSRDDLGKIIGKQGRTARAIRTILGAVSAKTKKRVVLEILE